MLEVGGWNVETDFDCTSLQVSQTDVKLGEPVTVTANIANTFLDGSRVTLILDGQPAVSKWAWARAGKSDTVSFDVQLGRPGRHRLQVGKTTGTITVR